MAGRKTSHPRSAFTLIELLVVISIIALLISILLPSLSRAREQAKSIHCLARLKEFGNALATYENTSSGTLPPPRWFPSAENFDPSVISDLEQPLEYGWAEILFTHVYRDAVRVGSNYPAQRNVDGGRWEKYFICEAVGDEGASSGHYRIYLPSWSGGSIALDQKGGWIAETQIDSRRSTPRDRIRPRMPLMGDANEFSERGDGRGLDDCSYIDAGEANYAGSDGRTNGNRFSDRHYGGTNFLFQDLHGAHSTRLRQDLARDYDLNGVVDIDTTPE